MHELWLSISGYACLYVIIFRFILMQVGSVYPTCYFWNLASHAWHDNYFPYVEFMTLIRQSHPLMKISCYYYLCNMPTTALLMTCTYNYISVSYYMQPMYMYYTISMQCTMLSYQQAELIDVYMSLFTIDCGLTHMHRLLNLMCDV